MFVNFSGDTPGGSFETGRPKSVYKGKLQLYLENSLVDPSFSSVLFVRPSRRPAPLSIVVLSSLVKQP